MGVESVEGHADVGCVADAASAGDPNAQRGGIGHDRSQSGCDEADGEVEVGLQIDQALQSWPSRRPSPGRVVWSATSCPAVTTSSRFSTS